MDFGIASVKLTGVPHKGNWSQIYEFTPQNPQEKEKRGRLFLVVSLEIKKKDLESVVGARKILAGIREEYFRNLEESAFDHLKSCVLKVVQGFSGFGSLEIAAVAILKNIVYISVAGGARALALREGNFYNLVKSLKDEVFSASGYGRSGDIIILGTEDFFKKFPLGQIKAALGSENFSNAFELLAPSLHLQEESAGVGVLALKFGKKDKETAEFSTAFLKKISPFLVEEPGLRKFTSIISRQFKSISNFGKFFVPERVYVRREEAFLYSRKKVSLSVGVLLFALLMVSIFLGIKEKRRLEERAEYEKELSLVEHQLQEAEALFTLNPIRSRELLQEVRNKVLGFAVEVNDLRLEDIRRRVHESEEKILGEYGLDPQIFVDLSLLTKSFKGDSLALFQPSVYVLDKEGRKLAEVSIKTKRTELVFGPDQLTEVEGFTVYSDRIFFVNPEGIFEAGKGKVIEKDWQAEILPFAYAGNFYILDKRASKIYKFQGFEKGFGPKRDWLNEGEFVDLSGAQKLVIDGSIWVLTKDSEVLKFSLGKRIEFKISGVFPEIQELKSFYTSEELGYIYLLESSKGRVVVVDKNGEFKAQYLSDKIKEAQDIVVSEEEKKIILLGGDKLLSIEVKHRF